MASGSVSPSGRRPITRRPSRATFATAVPKWRRVRDVAHAVQWPRLCWWSAGVTDYSADLTTLRSGLWTPNQFLENALSNIQQVDDVPEPWSVEDGSEATWIKEVYVNSSQLYYPKGSLLGFLLDISIRDATDNAHNLDEVMRALYTRYYRENKGFQTADLLNELRATGMPDV